MAGVAPLQLTPRLINMSTLWRVTFSAFHKEIRMQMRRSTLALAAALGLSASSVFAEITGTVTFKGDAPEPQQIDMAAVKECAQQHPDGAFDESVVVNDGKLANVVVSVKAEPGGDVPKQPAVLDQKGCQYRPHVIAVMTGQPIQVKNSDPFLHNVHSLALDNPAFNFGQPNIDPGKKVDPMKAPERFKIKCDVHPWMSAQVSVFEHPFFAVTKEDGTFTIPGNVPDGEHTLVFWHEKFGEKEQKVMVSGGKAEANAEFEAAAADAGNQPNPVEVKLAVFEAKASAKAETTKAGSEKECCTAAPSKAAALKSVAKAPAAQPQASAR